jgi:cytochrome b-561 domain-containing protein 2
MAFSSALALGFTGYLLYNVQPGHSFFSWHPTMMILAYGWLLFEGIQSFSKSNPLLSRIKPSKKLTIHWIMTSLGLVCICVGMGVVYTHKEAMGKPHFTSLHSKLGAAANTCAFGAALGGVLAKYRLSFGIPATIKLGHALFGVLVFILGTLALFTGLASQWFVEVVMVNTSSLWRIINILPAISLFVIVMQVVRSRLR